MPLRARRGNGCSGSEAGAGLGVGATLEAGPGDGVSVVDSVEPVRAPHGGNTPVSSAVGAVSFTWTVEQVS
jgi:hypothetical protein